MRRCCCDRQMARTDRAELAHVPSGVFFIGASWLLLMSSSSALRLTHWLTCDSSPPGACADRRPSLGLVRALPGSHVEPDGSFTPNLLINFSGIRCVLRVSSLQPAVLRFAPCSSLVCAVPFNCAAPCRPRHPQHPGPRLYGGIRVFAPGCPWVACWLSDALQTWGWGVRSQAQKRHVAT